VWEPIDGHFLATDLANYTVVAESPSGNVAAFSFKGVHLWADTGFEETAGTQKDDKFNPGRIHPTFGPEHEARFDPQTQQILLTLKLLPKAAVTGPTTDSPAR
jgi:hypothetical protein